MRCWVPLRMDSPWREWRWELESIQQTFELFSATAEIIL